MHEYNPYESGYPLFCIKKPDFIKGDAINEFDKCKSLDDQVLSLNIDNLKTISKSDMPQVVPPEFSIKDIKSWNNNAIKEVMAIGGDIYDGKRC